MAPSSYGAAKTRAPSARTLRDEELIGQLVVLWEANYRVYGVRMLAKAARRAGIMIGQDQTARLMRAARIEGAGGRSGSRSHERILRRRGTRTS